MKMKKICAVLLIITISLSGTVLTAGCSDSRSESDKNAAISSRKDYRRDPGKTSIRDSGKDSRRNRSKRSARESAGDAAKDRYNNPAGGSTRDPARGSAKKSSGDSAVGTTEESGRRAAGDSGGRQKAVLDPDWKYASFSKIHTGEARLYLTGSSDPRGITVCVNAGHGTKNGSSEQTQCHPDGSPKLVSGTTSKGDTMSPAISEGMTFTDGTTEADATLSLALILKDKLLAAGYDVLMIRETKDVQLDNIARTVIANHYARCHIALHYDSTSSDKGAFYMAVPDVRSYREMEPVKSMWREHHKLGNALISGLKKEGIPIFNDGTMAMDLTQTSYSTIPSVDLEVGDAGSDISEEKQEQIADGILRGINSYYK